MLLTYLYISSLINLQRTDVIVAEQKVNEQVLNFSKLFFDKVLQGSKEVSFDDRLLLENGVRSLNDREIFDSWTKFTNSRNQGEIQGNFYNLFQLLLEKIKP